MGASVLDLVEAAAELVGGGELLFGVVEVLVGVVEHSGPGPTAGTGNRSRGTTVLLTTHDLVDVERLCRRLVVIDGGRIIEDGTVEGVRARYGTERTLVVDLAEPGPLLAVEGARVVRVEGPRQWLRFQRDDHTAASLLAEVGALAPVRDVTIEEPAIDDVVARIYAGAGTPAVDPASPVPVPGPAGPAGRERSQP